jgi:UDP-N-acetylglucosamine 1-carboxyvinyltransferase
MDKMVVTGNGPLKGTVATSGAKNAALPILFSSLLAEGTKMTFQLPSNSIVIRKDC